MEDGQRHWRMERGIRGQTEALEDGRECWKMERGVKGRKEALKHRKRDEVQRHWRMVGGRERGMKCTQRR